MSASRLPSITASADGDQRQQFVRLGVIDYLNVAPVYDAMRRDASLLPGVELVAGVPSAMNAALLAGEIDLSNVSSVAFGQHADEWLLVPGLSVAAQEKVESVLLFSWHADWRALDGGSIALSSDSATSVALVRLLAEERYGAHPHYVTAAPDLDAMLAEHDAALLIGDVALVEGQIRREIAGRGKPYVFDLATEWRAWTGLPFVFAVWAARADRARGDRRQRCCWGATRVEAARAKLTWNESRPRRLNGLTSQKTSACATCACWIMIWASATWRGCGASWS